MKSFISAIQKLVIKDVVLYADKKIAAARPSGNAFIHRAARRRSFLCISY